MVRYVWLYAIFSLTSVCGASSDHLGGSQERLQEHFSETQGSVVIGGKQLSYTATAGNLILEDDQDKEMGSIFFVAYRLSNPPEGAPRPTMFCTNGGPGSSATWLHLGLFGPKRIVCDEQGAPLSPPQLVNNEYSILDVTDLVFIDPISTGFSRAAPGQSEKEFHGVEEDAKWIGEFMRLYLSRFGGWDGPLYFAGESYGTTRAAELATSLLDQQRIYLERMVLISAALNFQAFSFAFGNDLPFITMLPSYTAAAWHFHKLPEEQQQKSLEELLKEAEAFAMTDYNVALMKGDSLSPEEEKEITMRLASYTGLDEDFLRMARLRVYAGRFRAELLRKEGEIIGRYDSRYVGPSLRPVVGAAEYDPAFDAYFGPFNAAINSYVRNDLKWESGKNYELLNNLPGWKWGEPNAYLNVSESLREGILRNQRLKVFVASGRYDLALPYLATRYALEHLGIKERIMLRDYDGGHMMYLQLPMLKTLSADIREFLK